MKIPSADNDAWNSAEGNVNEKPSLIRYRPNLECFLGHKEYSRRLVIFWDYEIDNLSGLPSPEENDEMRKFEDAIIDALDHDRLAILAFVYTNNGVREWHWYTANIEVVSERINNALSAFPKLPIELQVEDDAEWEELKQVINMCN